MTNCIFCRIASKELPSGIVYEDENTLAFKDINPISPVHILVIPKKHFCHLSQISEEDPHLAGHLLFVVNHIAKQEGLTENGYRVVINCGEWGGQIVQHLHLHLLGGRQLTNELG